MKIYKKIIATSLATIIGAEAVSASSLSDAMGSNNFLNVTPGGNYNINGKDIYTTTSVYFRFGPSSISYEPIYHISPPEFEASCSGFNLKGLFLSILGWDRISKMLKSSGASFAWGVVVGLVYSLPGIFSSFKMLNKWAKQIMALMQNACNAGKKVGEAIMKGSSIDKGIKDNKTKLTGWISKLPDVQDATDLVEDGAKFINNTFGLGNFTSGLSGIGGTQSTSQQPSSNDLLALYTKIATSAYAETQSTQYLNQVFAIGLASGNETEVINILNNSRGTAFSAADKLARTSIRIKLNGTSSSGSAQGDIVSLSDLASVSSSSEQKRIIYANYFKALMAYNLVPHKRKKQAALEKGMDSLKDIYDNFANGGTPPIDSIKVINDLISGNSLLDTESSKNGLSKYQAAEKLGKYFGYIFMKLDSNSVEATTFESNTLKSLISTFKTPTYEIIKAKEDPSTASSMLLYVTEIGNSTDNGFQMSDITTSTNETFYDKSKKAISKIVYDNNTPNAATTAVGIPLLTSLSQNYVRIIKQTPKEKRDRLISKIAELNTCIYGASLFDIMSTTSFGELPTKEFYSLNTSTTGATTTTELNFSVYSPSIKGISSAENSGLSEALKYFNKGLSDAILNSTNNILSFTSPPPKDKQGLKATCALIEKDVIERFEKQDLENRKKASSLIKQQ